MDPAGQGDLAAQARQGPARQQTESVTRGGVRVTRTEEPFRADDIDQVCARADERRGGVLSSGMEYPGRSLAGLRGQVPLSCRVHSCSLG